MAEVDSIQRLLGAISALDIQRVVAPRPEERIRTTHLQETSLSLPPIAPWRLQTPIGATLPPTDLVRTNCFQINTDRMPSAMFKYAVHIFPLNADGSDREEVSQKEDDRITAALLAKLRSKHPAWSGVGFGYDGRSILVTSATLNLPSRNPNGEPFLSERVGLPDRSGTSCGCVSRQVVLLTRAVYE